MRIAMVSSWQVPCGIARYTEELVSALEQTGKCQVTVLPVGPQVWRKQNRPLGWWHERAYWQEAAQKANTADLVHIQFAPTFFGGLKPFRNLLPFFLRHLAKPTVITVHEVDLTGTPLLRFAKRWEQKRLFCAGRNCRFITLTKFVAEQLQQLGCEKVCVLPIWVPTLSQPIPVAAAKERLGLTGRFVVVSFGFIIARRGYETLLEALPALPEDTVLVLAGGAHPLDRSGYYERLIARIAEHPLRSRIYVTGYLPDEEVDWWLAAADVVAAPYRYLSGSASLMRAFAHGKPILASDLPPLRELAEQSGAVVLVPPDQPDAWAEALLKLRNEEERLLLSDAAKQFARQRTVHHIAEKHCVLFAAVLSNEPLDSVLS